MSRKSKEAIILAIDCGKSMSESALNGSKSVFELSKQCLENIIRQKIFAETKNEYLLIELSSYDNPNDLKAFRNLCSPNFDLLGYISKGLKSTHNPTNLMDGLDAVITETLERTEGHKFSELKIVLLTNFGQLTERDLFRFRNDISVRLTHNFIKLILICDFTVDNHLGRDLSKSQIRALDLMKVIEDESNPLGFCYELESAIQQFNEFEGRKTSPNPWYAKLELGTGVNALSIAIGAYIKAEPYKRKTGTQAYIRPNTESVDMTSMNSSVKPNEVPIDKGVVFKSRDGEMVEELDKEEVISAYSFGQTLVPFGEDDKKQFNYTNKTEKGFKIIGFTSVLSIDDSQRIGKKSYYVFPDPRLSPSAPKLVFQTLVRAMADLNKVAIVRYNWSNNSNPQIGYLWPLFEDNRLLLVYIQLPFDEDVRKYRFPSLDRKPIYCPTNQQLEAIDDLIDSMDLMSAGIDEEGNPCEVLQTGEISDPILQYWFECLYHRQMNGLESDLPQVSDYLKDLMEPPLELCKKALRPLTQISANFSLEVIKDKSKKRNPFNVSLSQSASGSQSEPKRARISDENSEDVIAIERIKSEVNDMIETKLPFEVIRNKFSNSIKDFFVDNSKLEALSEEIIELIELFRKESIGNSDPNPFNEFMLNFIDSYRGTDIWYIMLSKGIGLIGQTECPQSEASQQMVENYMSLSDDIKTEMHSNY